MKDTVEKDVEGLAEKIIAEDEKRRAQELVCNMLAVSNTDDVKVDFDKDVFTIAPKRPNWDLKRELERKLAKLERQTQKAVHTLISLWTSSCCQ
jgi:coiled-coil domain-containing protein 12